MKTTMRVRLTAPIGGVVKGLGYLIGSLFVVARSNAAAGAMFTGATAGIWPLRKTSAQAWTEGQKIYWNLATSKADSDGTTGPLIGTAAAVVANPSTTGRVRLNAAAAATAEGPQAAVAALTGTLTGTVNSALVDIAAAAGNCQGTTAPTATEVDTAIATAVAPIVSGTNEQLKELQTTVNAVRAALVAAGILAAA